MKQQSGFTLIELIVSLSVLTVLSATALPRFGSVLGDARQAKMISLAVSLRVSAVTAHGQSLAEDLFPSSSISLQDGTNIAMSGYFPDATTDGILATFDNRGYASRVANGTEISFYPDETHATAGTCGVNYYPSNFAAPYHKEPVIDVTGISSVAACA